MPAFHLVEPGYRGITMINIGTGPSNARTITDHVAVLRPHAWLMLGHCAGLRNTQKLGDYVLAHGYVREDHVLDQELPLWVPIPALAEMQVALEQAVGEVTGLAGFELKRVMRTGTVASVDNRNWEIGDPAIIRRLSQSRAIALDMESAAIAANGFRFRVPYGTLLCVSDKPLHGEIKLAGMATSNPGTITSTGSVVLLVESLAVPVDEVGQRDGEHEAQAHQEEEGRAGEQAGAGAAVLDADLQLGLG